MIRWCHPLNNLRAWSFVFYNNPANKVGRDRVGDGRREKKGWEQDSQGCGNWEKLRKILQRSIILQQKWDKEEGTTGNGWEVGVKGMGNRSRRYRKWEVQTLPHPPTPPPLPPLIKLLINKLDRFFYTSGPTACHVSHCIAHQKEYEVHAIP